MTIATFVLCSAWLAPQGPSILKARQECRAVLRVLPLVDKETISSALDRGTMVLERNPTPNSWTFAHGSLDMSYSDRGTLLALSIHPSGWPGAALGEEATKKLLVDLARAVGVEGERYDVKLVESRSTRLPDRPSTWSGTVMPYFGEWRSTRGCVFQFEEGSRKLKTAYFWEGLDNATYRSAQTISQAVALNRAWQAYLAGNPAAVSEVLVAEPVLGIPYEGDQTNYTPQVAADFAERRAVPHFRVVFLAVSGSPGPTAQGFIVDARDGRVLQRTDDYSLAKSVRPKPAPQQAQVGGQKLDIRSGLKGSPAGKRVLVEGFAGYWDTKTDRLWLSMDGKEWRSFKLSGDAAKELDKRPTPKSPFKA